MPPEITIASSDQLFRDYSGPSEGDYVKKVGDHMKYIMGGNYNVYTEANPSEFSYYDYDHLSHKGEVASWFNDHSYTQEPAKHVHLLLISNKKWNAGATAGTQDEAACVMSVSPDIFNMASPSNIELFYYGTSYGPGMLNGCIHELGHCWGMNYNDGYVCYNSDTTHNHRSPMGGRYTESENNCGETITKYEDHDDEYLHGYYDWCETGYFENSIAEAYTQSAWPC